MEKDLHNKTIFAASHGIPASALIITAASVGIALSATLCAMGHYLNAAILAAAVLASGFALASRISIETILTLWFVASPIASFFVRFPVEKSLLTFDRVVFAAALLLLLLKFKQGKAFFVTRFEIVWALLATLAVISVAMKSANTGYAIKIAVDSFWLPLVAFHLARHHFDVRGRNSALMAAAIALALMLFLTGAFEFLTGTNLFQYKGSELVREGERRVNGPFASDSSFAIICLLLTIFLGMSPRFLCVRLDRGARIVYAVALVLIAIATLLPLFRAVAAALLLCLLVASFLIRSKSSDASPQNSPAQSSPAQKSPMQKSIASRRALWIASIATGLILLVAGWTVFESSLLGGRLASPRNAYGRLATWEAAAKIALENPLSGVGIANYTDYFRDKYFGARRERESVFRARAIDSPHSNPLWIASELGLIGFALYLAANVYIFLMGYRAFKRAAGTRQRAAAACYLALVIAYWVPGLTLTSGAYSDLNLYFFFLLGLLLSICRSSDERPQLHST